MRILFIVPGLGLGGTERFLLRLALAAQEHHEIQVISLGSDRTLAKEFESAGIPLTLTPITSAWNFLSQLFLLREEVKAFEPDVVQTFLYKADLLGGLTARSLGIHRIFWSLRHSVLRGGPRQLKRNTIVRTAALLSHMVPRGIIAVSSDSAASHQAVGFDKSKMVTIPNMLENWVVESAGSLTGKPLGGTKPRVGMAARFAHEKGHDLLLEATRLSAARGQDLLLDFCGMDTEAGGGLYRYVLENFPDLMSSCTFRGGLHGEDYRDWFKGIDVFVLPSRTEGFPNALAEAFMLGLPCVSTNVGAAPEILNSSSPSVICETNAESITSGLCSIVPCLQSGSYSNHSLSSALPHIWSVEQVLSSYEKHWGTD